VLLDYVFAEGKRHSITFIEGIKNKNDIHKHNHALIVSSNCLFSSGYAPAMTMMTIAYVRVMSISRPRSKPVLLAACADMSRPSLIRIVP
jgi:hypothetical protein